MAKIYLNNFYFDAIEKFEEENQSFKKRLAIKFYSSFQKYKKLFNNTFEVKPIGTTSAVEIGELDEWIDFLTGKTSWKTLGARMMSGRIQKNTMESFNSFLIKTVKKYKTLEFGYEPIDVDKLEKARKFASYQQRHVEGVVQLLPKFENMFGRKIVRTSDTYRYSPYKFGPVKQISTDVGIPFKNLLINLKRLANVYVIIQQQIRQIIEFIKQEPEMYKALGLNLKGLKGTKRQQNYNWQENQRKIQAHKEQLSLLFKEHAKYLIKVTTQFNILEPVLKKEIKKLFDKGLLDKTMGNKFKKFAKEQLPYYIPIVGSLKHISDDPADPMSYGWLTFEIGFIMASFKAAVVVKGIKFLSWAGVLVAEDAVFLASLNAIVNNINNALVTYDPRFKSLIAAEGGPFGGEGRKPLIVPMTTIPTERRPKF